MRTLCLALLIFALPLAAAAADVTDAEAIGIARSEALIAFPSVKPDDLVALPVDRGSNTLAVSFELAGSVSETPVGDDLLVRRADTIRVAMKVDGTWPSTRHQPTFVARLKPAAEQKMTGAKLLSMNFRAAPIEQMVSFYKKVLGTDPPAMPKVTVTARAADLLTPAQCKAFMDHVFLDLAKFHGTD